MKPMTSRVLFAPCFPSNITAGITHKAFFTRRYVKPEGDEFKAEFAALLQARCGLTPQLLTQVHGTGVLHATGFASGQAATQQPCSTYPKADGHCTLEAGLCLGVLVADCAGVLLHDASTGYIAVLHSGWQGTAHNIVAACIEGAKARGVVCPASLTAWISPCARSCCYEVGDDVVRYFINTTPDACSYNTSTKKYMLDLARVIAAQLVACGVPEHRVYTALECSMCSENFHSYRREGATSGRSLVFIARHAHIHPTGL